MSLIPPKASIADLERFEDFLDLDTDSDTLFIHTHRLAEYLGVPNDRPGRLHSSMPIVNLARRLGWEVKLVGIEEDD